MARFLHLFVGVYDGVMYDDEIKIIGQTTETGDQMVARGENISLMMEACKKGRIGHAMVTVFEYSPPSPGCVGLALTSFQIDATGRLSGWPSCMFAIENALCQL
jgi:hypothetical protein